MTDEEKALHDRLKRALECLRRWRDRWGDREHYKHGGSYLYKGSASPTDLLRETTRILEGR